jgi:hypothetical protein
MTVVVRMVARKKVWMVERVADRLLLDYGGFEVALDLIWIRRLVLLTR